MPSLVAVGAVIDFFLKKKDVKKLHGLFLRWEESLSETPLRGWQISIANAGYNALHFLRGDACKIIIKGLDAILGPVVDFVGKWTRHPLVTLAVVFLLYSIVPLAYFISHWWFLGSIAFPFLMIWLIVVSGIIIGIFNRGISKDWLEKVFNLFMGIPIISALLSLLAVIVTLYGIPEDLLDTDWYVLVKGGIKPAYPFLLPIVNLPFDLATIAVTIKLLGYVRRNRAGFLVVAFLDIILSLAFSIILYALLRMIACGWDIQHFHHHLIGAMVWFGEIAVCLWRYLIGARPVGLAGMQDIHLLPILLTTFVPVALYMGAFVLLAFCKPVMWLAGRFFGVIGERDESVFKQFATLLAVLLAALKTIYDYLTI